MATAKQPGGLYWVDGVAVDADGKKVDGAPKPEKDTPPEMQPGALGSANTPEERMANAIASALKPGAVARAPVAPAAPAASGGGARRAARKSGSKK